MKVDMTCCQDKVKLRIKVKLKCPQPPTLPFCRELYKKEILSVSITPNHFQPVNMWPILRPAWMASYLGTVPPVVSSIRQNPPEAEPTLDSIPQVDEPIIKDQPLSSIIRYMQEDGFHAWGFAVYRCAYVSALQWASYLEFLKEAVREYLEFVELEPLLWKHLERTII